MSAWNCMPNHCRLLPATNTIRIMLDGEACKQNTLHLTLASASKIG
jgi:hypothetical protein